MALIPLTILVPLLAAGLLTAARPISNRTFADVVALGASVAVLVLCAILTHRAAHHDLVYWFGGWRPHHGVALGISFAFGALGAGFATFCAALMVAALVFSWRFMEDLDSLSRRAARVLGGDGRLLPERRPVQHVRLLRADGSRRIRARRVHGREARAARGLVQPRRHQQHRRHLVSTALPNAYWAKLGLKGFADPYRRFRDAKRTAPCGPARRVVWGACG
jgi:hypothetical protein